MVHRSTSVSSHYSINANHRQRSLTGTNHYDSKLSKVIQFEKKQSLNTLIFEKISNRIIKKTIFLVKNIEHILFTSQCFFQTLITVSSICSIIFQYLSPLFFHFFVFISPSFSSFARLSWGTFYNLATLFNSIWLQPEFDCSMSLQYTIQKIFTKLQTTF